MNINPFFKNKGPFKIEKLLKLSGIDNNENFIKSKILDIRDLSTATKDDITFFHSKKYEELASKTKAFFCITTGYLKDYLPNHCNKIIVDNVLIATAKITKVFYPDSVTDDFDSTVKDISKTLFKKKVKFGKNVLIGKDVLIMATVHIAHDCVIGDNAIIVNGVALAGHVTIGDYAIIGGLAAIHQFIHIGDHAMVSGGSLVRKDVPPYTKAAKEPLSYVGINSIGLRRRGFSTEKISEIQNIYRILYQKNYNTSQAVGKIEAEMEATSERDEILLFIRNSQRGIMKGYNQLKMN